MGAGESKGGTTGGDLEHDDGGITGAIVEGKVGTTGGFGRSDAVLFTTTDADATTAAKPELVLGGGGGRGEPGTNNGDVGNGCNAGACSGAMSSLLITGAGNRFSSTVLF